MKVATWNLLHCLDVRTGRVDLGAVADAVGALDVDVLAVQEVDREQERSGRVDQVAELAAKLGWHGVFAPALLGNPARRWGPGPGGDDDPGGPAYGVGLLSRHPLHAVARRALPGGGTGERRPEDAGRTAPGWDREPRVILRAAVGSTGLVITTTHLTYLPWRGIHQLRVALAWATAGGGIPLLMGDLNLPRRALRPALAAFGWSAAGAGATFPSWRPGMQLDHILGRRGLVTDVRVGERGPSDHLPVVGRINLP